MCVSVSKGKPRSLQHLCRLVIRSHMSLRTLNDPETMAAGPFPPRLMNYLTYREYDLYGDLLSVWNMFYLYMWLKCEKYSFNAIPYFSCFFTDWIKNQKMNVPHTSVSVHARGELSKCDLVLDLCRVTRVNPWMHEWLDPTFFHKWVKNALC